MSLEEYLNSYEYRVVKSLLHHNSTINFITLRTFYKPKTFRSNSVLFRNLNNHINNKQKNILTSKCIPTYMFYKESHNIYSKCTYSFYYTLNYSITQSINLILTYLFKLTNRFSLVLLKVSNLVYHNGLKCTRALTIVLGKDMLHITTHTRILIIKLQFLLTGWKQVTHLESIYDSYLVVLFGYQLLTHGITKSLLDSIWYTSRLNYSKGNVSFILGYRNIRLLNHLAFQHLW
jgi:hypothetical protein